MKKVKRAGTSMVYMIVCLLLGIILALQIKSTGSHRDRLALQNIEKEELIAQYETLIRRNRELVDENNRLNDAIRNIDERSSSDSISLQLLEGKLQQCRIFAGLLPVEGPGGILTLSLQPGAILPEDYLHRIVNEFRSNNAQAISINDQRVVSMTEIRKTGTTANPAIMVNGHNILGGSSADTAQTVVIKVISGEQDFRNAMDFLRTIRSSLSEYRVTTSEVTSEKVQIPALPEDSPAYRIGQLSLQPEN